jgi:hypothetical protein
MTKLIALTVLIVLANVNTSISQTEFSCPIGTDAKCLNYSDQICDGNFGKCVKRDSNCFDQYACGIGGQFVCKSKLDDVVALQETCVLKYNTLLDDLDSSAQMLKRDRIKYDELLDENQSLKSCVSLARTLEDAKSCR